MLRAAARAPALLPDGGEAAERFVAGRLNADGGFADRRGRSDLYYTVFGIGCLSALAAHLPLEALAGYLRTFGGGGGLDLVHLTCLARCWSALPPGRLAPADRRQILDRLERHRSADGGYGPAPAAGTGTAYACFLALGAYDDLAADLPRPGGVVGCLESLRTADGAYANQPGSPVGFTAATAAAVTALRHLGQPPGPQAADWLMARLHASGGFVAAPPLPAADLLSTATALHALAGMDAPLEAIRRPCAGFVLALASPEGGFRGHRDDQDADCEYTYYALLALGHLAG